MNLSQLRVIVRRFVDGEISYPAFRAQFVGEYLAVLHANLDLDRDVNVIEHLCSDFDEGDLSGSKLREELSAIASMPILISASTPSPFSESRSSQATFITATT